MPFESKASRSVTATGSQGAPKHQLKRCNNPVINRQLNKPFWTSQVTLWKGFFARCLFTGYLTSHVPANCMLHITSTHPDDTELSDAPVLLSISQSCLLTLLSPYSVHWQTHVFWCLLHPFKSPLISYWKKTQYANRESVKPLMPFQCWRSRMGTHLDTKHTETN